MDTDKIKPPASEETEDEGAAERPLSRAAIYDLAYQGRLDGPVFEAALRFWGARPDRRAWALFRRRLLTLTGALLLTAGVICFFAWNWADLHRFAKFALLGALILALAGLWARRGLEDSPGRQAALLAAGLTIGPLLAVYGQSYQTGAFFWELFRAWTGFLLPLALLGRQAALWLCFWLAANVWGWGYLQTLGEGFGYGAPEYIALNMLAIVIREGAARFWGSRPGGQEWLREAWLPRLMVLAVTTALTVFVIYIIFEDFPKKFLLIPFRPGIVALYLANLAALWFRFKRRDVFMPAAAMFSLAAVFIFLIIKIIPLPKGEAWLLMWLSFIIMGLSFGCGKFLIRLQRTLEAENAAENAAEIGAEGWTEAGTEETGTEDGPENIKYEKTGAAGRRDWPALWAHLRSLNLWPAEEEPPVPPLAGPAWFIGVMLSFAAWLSALLLIGSIYVPLFHYPLAGSLIFLGAGAFCARRPGLFGRQVGLALTLAGCLGVGWELARLLDAPYLSGLMVSFLAFFITPQHTFRFIAAAAGLFCLTWLWVDAGSGLPDSAALRWLAVLWGGLAAAAGRLWATEEAWLSRAREFAPPLQAIYPVMLAVFFMALDKTLFLNSLILPAMGLGAGFGFLTFLLYLRPGPPRRSRAYLGRLAGGLLALPLGYFLPGVSLALFGFALGRQTGNAVLLGSAGTALCAFLIQYYWTLDTTLLNKSLTLAAAGAALLAAARLTRRKKPATALNEPGGDDGALEPNKKWRRSLLRRSLLRRSLLFAALGLALAGFALSAAGKEDLIKNGEVIYLEIAPHDPRAPLLGDYMALRFTLNRPLTEAARATREGGPRSGTVIVTLDTRRIAAFKRLDDGTPLAPNERRLRWRWDKTEARATAAAFFFQEGRAEDYEAAKFGEIHAAGDGANILVRLLDKDLKKIR